MCQGARHPPALPAFVASQSIPGTKEASDLTLTSQWTQVSPPCHYIQWGILGGEPLATVSILNIHCVYSRQFPALLTPGFATKSPQSITTLPFFHPQTLHFVLFQKYVSVEDSRLGVTGPGISMLTQPSVPTQNISLLASSCFAVILRDYYLILSFHPCPPKKRPTSL